MNNIIFLEGFEESFRRFKNADISGRYKEFINHKKINKDLPENFNDHALRPPFNGSIREVHLASNILLFYFKENNNINLIVIDDHNRIKTGSKSEKQAAKRWNLLTSK